MPNEIYKIKISADAVYITVNVQPTGGIEDSTIQLITTVATQVGASSGSGSVPKSLVGAGNALNISLLFIETNIYFTGGMSSDAKQNIFNNLKIDYVMEGGVVSPVTFPCKADEKKLGPAGDLITVNKYIDLIY
jgi:hypothetical protein